MRLMMRWSPMSSVFSIEPEGMTRACPIAPLISRKTSPTQNQEITSRRILAFTGAFSSFFFLSAFTMHHNRMLCEPGFTFYCTRRSARFSVRSALAYLQLYKVGRVNPRITRRTEAPFGIGDGLFEGRKREVAERVRPNEFAGLFRGVRGSDELFPRGRVHAVVAGRNRGRATDAHVNFFCAGFADHAHEFAAGGAADDGIVHEHDALAFNEAAHGVEFQLDAEIADGLRRLDEGAADVVIADQAHAKRNPGFESVADGGGNAGVGHGHDDIRFDGMLAGKQAAKHFAALVDGAAEDDAVRAREVDVLENALLMRLGGSEMNGLDAALGDAHHFARLDFADVLGVEQIEGAGF